MGDSGPREPLLGAEEHGSHREEEHHHLGASHDASNRGWLSERLQGGGSDGEAGGLQGGSPPTLPGYVPAGYHHLGPGRLPSRSKRTSAVVHRARRTAWICLDTTAKRSFLHADKRSLIMQLGLNIPIRDMRLLDFNLLTSETGKILVRDNAILFSIEHVRLIIAADKVLVPRDGYEHNPLSNRFVDVLEESLGDWLRQQHTSSAAVSIDGMSQSDYDDHNPMRTEAEVLPFELVVLEAALKEVLGTLGHQVKELEGVALPALDALEKSITTSNLERVRKVKTRHQRLVIRCETLRDELERFLQDDDDIAKMCLSRRKELEGQYRAAATTPERGGSEPVAALPPSSVRNYTYGMHTPHIGSFSRRSYLSGYPSRGPAAALSSSPSRGTSPPRMPFGRESSLEQPKALAGPSDEELNEAAAEDVENLLESYFMQVDGLADKLTAVGEYVKDTEEYINIELDSSRNKLILLDIVLTAASFAIAPFNLVAGILGENLVIPEQLTQSVRGFYSLNAIVLSVCLSIFSSIMLYMRYRKLI